MYKDYSTDTLRQFHFLLTDECNLRCVYCFHTKHPRTMTAQTMTRAVDWCLSVCGDEMRIQFFGGEPTLNWPVLSLAVRYGDMRATEMGKKMGFGLVTNASTLTAERAMFCKNNRIGVLLSYDGPHTNDLTRGHTEEVVAGLRNALAAGVRASVAMQLPSGHTRFMYENFVAIEEMGFATIAINPVTHCYEPYSDEDWDNIASGLKRIAEHQYERYATGKGAVYSQFSNQIQSVRRIASQSDWTPQARDASCGACKGSMAIDCDGNIIPCHEMPCGSGFDRYIMGNVMDGTYDPSMRKRFLETRNLEPCKNCPSTLCGSCRTTNRWATGDEFEPCLEACIFHLTLFETAAHLYNRLVADGIMQGRPFVLYRPIEETIADLRERDALRRQNS